jgi:O-antigen/teichoic acid export membrane protein
VSSPRVAESGAAAPGPGEARLLASGALVQQAAQASGLLALLVVVTLLARRLSVSELGAYGLVASLAGYLMVLRNSVAAAAVRAMAAAGPGERARTFTAAARLYARVGLVTGALIAAAALAIAAAVLDGDLAADARLGGACLGAVMGLGIAASVHLDALRAERLLVRAALTEIAGVAIYLALMLALILGGAGLAAVIAASGAMPLLSGLISMAEVRRLGLPFRLRGRAGGQGLGEILRTAGWLLVVELANLVSYAFDRVILGAFRSPFQVGLYEGPLRAHNLLYALGGALAVPTVPSAARYTAEGDERRLRELVVRGTRYTLALFVPLCVVLMALARPLLEAWLGDRYADGAAALTILVSYWLLLGGLAVTPGFLIGAGRARQMGLIMAAAAALNLALSLALTPVLGLEGPAVGTAVAFLAAFPFLLRQALAASGARLGELARRAWLPAYGLGALLAAALAGLRLAADPSGVAAVAAIAAAGVAAYWVAFYAIWLDREERALVRGLARPARPGSGERPGSADPRG